MTEVERELRELMRSKVEEAWRPPTGTRAVVRRARRRQTSAGVLVGALAVVIALGGITAGRLLLADRAITPSKPAPTENVVTSGAGMIAFVVETLDESQVAAGQLYAVDAGGGSAQVIPACPDPCEGMTVISADWSPDGSLIAFAIAPTTEEGIGDQAGIYVLDVSTGVSRQLTRCVGSCIRQGAGLDWSPDGSRIAYDEAVDGLCSSAWGFAGGCRVYTMASDGSDKRTVSTGGEVDDPMRPTWSPDGRALAVSGHVGEDWFVYAVELDGSGVELLSGDHPSREAVDPVWSPEGSDIAFTVVGHSSTGPSYWGSCEIWTVSARDLETRMVAEGCGVVGPGGAHGVGMDWSPDGSKLAYYDQERLRQIDPDGTGGSRVAISGAKPSYGVAWGG